MLTIAAFRSDRRVANRESARRVRQKRQETMDEMKSRLDVLTQQLHALTVRILCGTPCSARLLFCVLPPLVISIGYRADGT